MYCFLVRGRIKFDRFGAARGKEAVRFQLPQHILPMLVIVAANAHGDETVDGSFTPLEGVNNVEAPRPNESGGRPFTFQKMLVSQVEASSSLSEKNYVHSPEMAVDGNTTTAWVEGAKGNGIGEHLILSFTGGIPGGLAILPGYAYSEKFWSTNNRVSSLTLRRIIRHVQGDEVHDQVVLKMKTVDGVVPFNQWQYFDLGAERTDDMGADDINAIMLEISSVDDKNSKYQDTCISEIVLYKRGYL
jgi:hypothetical protein